MTGLDFKQELDEIAIESFKVSQRLLAIVDAYRLAGLDVPEHIYKAYLDSSACSTILLGEEF